MAESQNNETTHEIETIIKNVINKIINNIAEYEVIEAKPSRAGDIDEEQIIGEILRDFCYM